MELLNWLARNGGVVRTHLLYRAGFTRYDIASAVSAGLVERIRRSWIAVPDAQPELIHAARAGGLVTCVSFATQRGWWLTEQPTALHLAVGQASGAHQTATAAVLHCTGAIPSRRHPNTHWQTP